MLFFFLGLFQYGDLHLGQIMGIPSLFLGIHSCLHLSHLKPLMIISISAILESIEHNLYINLTFLGNTLWGKKTKHLYTCLTF